MYVINQEDCIKCGACMNACPVGAIEDLDGKYEISEKCIGCGVCANVCPINAIFTR